MSYTVQKLADLAGTSVRALHHYDAIGLLKPARTAANSYRYYEEAELLRLQQIMFFRELEFSLEEIKNILENPRFDIKAALGEHRKLIELKRKRLDELLKTIDKTIKRINTKKTMKDNIQDKDLYNGFTSEEADVYAKEAKERWGNTDAYKQSQARVAKMSKDDMAKVQKDGEDLMKEIALEMNAGKDATSIEIQKLITRHYNALRTFYEPNLTMYRGLGNMYVADERFTAYFEKFGKGLAAFMQRAINEYCDANGTEEKNSRTKHRQT